MSELLFKPASELATLIHTGQISSTDLVTAALERIEALQPTINAFTHIDAEGAARRRGGRDGRRSTAVRRRSDRDQGHRSGGGDALHDGLGHVRRLRAGHDAFVVRRIREAGFVIVGKTSMSELGILPVSEPRRFGPVRNPWDIGRTPGGKSGGAGAAVASGMLPLAHGADGAAGFGFRRRAAGSWD